MAQEQNPPHDEFDDVDLMQYVDGELDEATATALEAHLDRAGEASDDWLKVQALDQMSDTVRSYLELQADAAEPRLDSMWEVIGAKIAEDTGVEGARQSRSQSDDTRAVRVGRLARIVGFFEGYRGHILTGAVAAGAAAAMILALRPSPPEQIIVERPIVVRPQPAQQVNQKVPDNSANNLAQEPEVALPQVKLVADEPSAPEIEELEVHGGSGTVFVLPSEGEDDVSATVIFIDFDEAEGPIL